MQVRDRIEKENVCGQPKGALPPLPPPGQKIDIKVILCICAALGILYLDAARCQELSTSYLARMLTMCDR